MYSKLSKQSNKGGLIDLVDKGHELFLLRKLRRLHKILFINDRIYKIDPSHPAMYRVSYEYSRVRQTLLYVRDLTKDGL